MQQYCDGDNFSNFEFLKQSIRTFTFPAVVFTCLRTFEYPFISFVYL